MEEKEYGNLITQRISMSLFFKNSIIPRLIFIPYFFVRVFIEIINIFSFFKFIQKKKSETLLCIESGEQGWELIECKEIYLSASEYIGASKVKKISITKNISYINQVYYNLKKYKPTHYLYDSRTGSQKNINGFIQSVIISFLFQINGVVPICTLTDLPMRNWRLQTAIVTCKRGIVISLMSPKDISSIYPHNRLIGPLTMPFSNQTLSQIELLNKSNRNNKKDRVVFVGSLYQPRTNILNQIHKGLKKNNINFLIKGRNLGSSKVIDDIYWLELINAEMIVITANQVTTKLTDWSHLNHLIYRYIEVPICDSVLVAQKVPGLEKYFQEDVHYISYNSPEEAIKKISYFINNKNKLDQIRFKGKNKAISIIKSNLYWNTVDSNLKRHSLI